MERVLKHSAEMSFTWLLHSHTGGDESLDELIQKISHETHLCQLNTFLNRLLLQNTLLKIPFNKGLALKWLCDTCFIEECNSI